MNHGIKPEIESAIFILQGERSDLEQLLSYIEGNNVSPRQVPGLLKSAHKELLKLRRALVALKQHCDPHSVALIERISACLAAGQTFSFEDITCDLESICKQFSSTENKADSAARALEALAMISMLKQEYKLAAELYSKAATTMGLGIESQWHYQKESAICLISAGREFFDKPALLKAVKLLENETLSLASLDQRVRDWATTKQLLGNAFGILGQRQTGTRNLENAITAFEESLGVRDRQKQSHEWAETQNSLGNALGALAQRQGDEEMLEKAVGAFKQALEVRVREKISQDWATTQNNLATVLQSQGQSKKDAKLLNQSVDAYKDVLEVWTKERNPLEWATTMSNLGTALRLLGEHRKGPRTLQQSVAAYNSALSIHSRERFPQEWAMAQNNLGASLQKLAEREENPETLKKAVSAYENALKEWPRERVPMAWSMTMANLGVARRTLAEVTEDPEIAHQAVVELEAVSDAFRNASHAQYSELSIDQLAQARKLADALDKEHGKYAGLVRH